MSSSEAERILKENQFQLKRMTKNGGQWSDGTTLLHVKQKNPDILAVRSDIKKAVKRRERDKALSQKLGDCLTNQIKEAVKPPPPPPKVEYKPSPNAIVRKEAGSLPPQQLKPLPQIAPPPPKVEEPSAPLPTLAPINWRKLNTFGRGQFSAEMKNQIYDVIKWLHYDDNDVAAIVKELRTLGYRYPNGGKIGGVYVGSAIKEMQADKRISQAGHLEYLKQKLYPSSTTTPVVIPPAPPPVPVAAPAPIPKPPIKQPVSGNRAIPESVGTILNNAHFSASKKVEVVRIWTERVTDAPDWILAILTDQAIDADLKVELLKVGCNG